MRMLEGRTDLMDAQTTLVAETQEHTMGLFLEKKLLFYMHDLVVYGD